MPESEEKGDTLEEICIEQFREGIRKTGFKLNEEEFDFFFAVYLHHFFDNAIKIKGTSQFKLKAEDKYQTLDEIAGSAKKRIELYGSNAPDYEKQVKIYDTALAMQAFIELLNFPLADKERIHGRIKHLILEGYADAISNSRVKQYDVMFKKLCGIEDCAEDLKLLLEELDKVLHKGDLRSATLCCANIRRMVNEYRKDNGIEVMEDSSLASLLYNVQDSAINRHFKSAKRYGARKNPSSVKKHIDLAVKISEFDILNKFTEDDERKENDRYRWVVKEARKIEKIYCRK